MISYNKYKNIKETYKGNTYDSRKELKRYKDLELLQKAHLISELERQKRFILQPSFTDNLGVKYRKIEYICDFFYYDKKEHYYVAEDVKSSATAKDKTYMLKKKLFMYKYPNIVFKEII